MFEVNIRFVGGLLSAYYLSGKEVSREINLPVFRFYLFIYFSATSALNETSGSLWGISACSLIDETDGRVETE